MVRKTTKPASSASSVPPLPDAIKDSAHEIWLAGLAAFSKAQQEGGKVFDAMVQEGRTIQRKAQATAEEKMAEATQKMSTLAGELSSRATGQWDKLETIFEDRVARALSRLGMPSAGEVETLKARVAELEKAVAARTPRTPRAAPAKSAPAKRPAARKTR